MFRFLAVVILAAAVSAADEYYDSDCKATAERIQTIPITLNKLLSLQQYTPDTYLKSAVEKYKTNAATVSGKSCAVDATKFDSSFDQLLKSCVAQAASEENKRKLAQAVSEGIASVQVVDQSLKMNEKLFGSTKDDSASSPGKIAKTKAQESLKTVGDKANEVLQESFHATKSSMDACVKTESKKLWGQIIDAAKNIPSC